MREVVIFPKLQNIPVRHGLGQCGGISGIFVYFREGGFQKRFRFSTRFVPPIRTPRESRRDIRCIEQLQEIDGFPIVVSGDVWCSACSAECEVWRSDKVDSTWEIGIGADGCEDCFFIWRELQVCGLQSWNSWWEGEDEGGAGLFLGILVVVVIVVMVITIILTVLLLVVDYWVRTGSIWKCGDC